MEDVKLFDDHLPIPAAKIQKYIFTDFIVNEAGELEYVSAPVKQLLEELQAEINTLHVEKEKIVHDKASLTEEILARKQAQDEQLEAYKQEKLAAIRAEIAELEATKEKLHLYRLFLPDFAETAASDLSFVEKQTVNFSDVDEALEHIDSFHGNAVELMGDFELPF